MDDLPTIEEMQSHVAEMKGALLCEDCLTAIEQAPIDAPPMRCEQCGSRRSKAALFRGADLPRVGLLVLCRACNHLVLHDLGVPEAVSADG
jgi:hypothetical protein